MEHTVSGPYDKFVRLQNIRNFEEQLTETDAAQRDLIDTWLQNNYLVSSRH